MKNLPILATLLVLALSIGCVSTGNVVSNSSGNSNAPVKEFYMDSFFVMEDGKPHPQFSVDEITVNKGDRIVIYVNATRGTHDFKIDELNVHSATPTGSVTKIEFVADKSGEFVYYCTMPNHRTNGHWGTLKVVE